MMVLGGGAVSYERGTPVRFAGGGVRSEVCVFAAAGANWSN